MIDGYGRNIDYLRVSVTDRCNLRCVYCMPEQGTQKLEAGQILTYEEILRVCRCAAVLGISRVKLTGGEPLVRKGLPGLARKICAIPGIQEVTLTTNGVLLGDAAQELWKAGVRHVNVSLDSLDPEGFAAVTRVSCLDKVLASVERALEAGMKVKINTLAARELHGDFNALASLAKERPLDVRFIEVMPLGCGKSLTPVPGREVLQRLQQTFGLASLCRERRGNGPAVYWDFPGFQGKIGFISAVSDRFCGGCNRVRLTSTGFLKLCLHYHQGVELKPLLRGGAGDEELLRAMREAIQNKPLHHAFGQAVPEGFCPEEAGMEKIGG